MDKDLVRQWVPDELWELAAPLVSPVRPRPQGGGTAMIDARAVLEAIGSMLTTGCAWRHLPPGFGVAVPTAHRRRPRASEKGGELTGASPVDRSKPGSKVHVVSDRGGLPLAVTVSAATTHDSQCREALVQAIPRSAFRRGRHRRRPDKLHLDNGLRLPPHPGSAG